MGKNNLKKEQISENPNNIYYNNDNFGDYKPKEE